MRQWRVDDDNDARELRSNGTNLQRVVHEDSELERDGARAGDDRRERVVDCNVVDVDALDERRILTACLLRYLLVARDRVEQNGAPNITLYEPKRTKRAQRSRF